MKFSQQITRHHSLVTPIDWKPECEAGKPEMARIRQRDSEHPIEQVGKGLRSMFSWLKAA